MKLVVVGIWIGVGLGVLGLFSASALGIFDFDLGNSAKKELDIFSIDEAIGMTAITIHVWNSFGNTTVRK